MHNTVFLRSLNFFLNRGSLRRCWSKYTQYPRNKVPAIPAAIPNVVRLISIITNSLQTIYFGKITNYFVRKFWDTPFMKNEWVNVMKHRQTVNRTEMYGCFQLPSICLCFHSSATKALHPPLYLFIPRSTEEWMSWK